MTVDGKEYYITPQGVMNTDIVEGLYVENNFSNFSWCEFVAKIEE